MQLMHHESLDTDTKVKRSLLQSVSYRQMAYATAVLAGLALAYWALRPSPIPVDVSVVTSGPMRVTADEEGKTRIREVFVVSAPIGGKVLRTPLEAGDSVKKDETVVAIIERQAPQLLDIRAYRETEAHIAAAHAAVKLAEAEVIRAKSELAFAESDQKRMQALLRSPAMSQRAIEKANLDAATAKAALERAEANLEVRRRELESAEARLIGPEGNLGTAEEHTKQCCVEIFAPADGQVLKRIHESEKVVLSGTPLIEIGDPKDLEIVVELLSTDAVKVREGAAATVEAWGGGKTLAAKVKRVEPSGFTKVSALGIEEQRVNVILDFVSPPEARTALGHDYRVFVRIDTWSSDYALRVPVSALFRKDGRWAVYKGEDDVATLTFVELGQRNAEFAEVQSGLSEQDRVILHPSDKVADQSRIAERQELTAE